MHLDATTLMIFYSYHYGSQPDRSRSMISSRPSHFEPRMSAKPIQKKTKQKQKKTQRDKHLKTMCTADSDVTYSYTCYSHRRRRRRFDGSPQPACDVSANGNGFSEAGPTPLSRSRRSTDLPPAAAATLVGWLFTYNQQATYQQQIRHYG